ncbi:MAG TPA: DnaB-like helicase N-terminal domain-containing protein, partial [Bacteroidota bacterium]|nr:DnaB-like helicase N-terminal domain-containing protein [Bacteroidota bacterium]
MAEPLRNIVPVSTPEGRVPPQAVEIEAQVLGAMLLDREAIPRVIEVLDEDAFHADYHRKIFQAIVAMFDRSEPVDI